MTNPTRQLFSPQDLVNDVSGLIFDVSNMMPNTEKINNLDNEVLNMVNKYKKSAIQLSTWRSALAAIPDSDVTFQQPDGNEITIPASDFITDYITVSRLRGAGVILDLKNGDTQNIYIATCSHLIMSSLETFNEYFLNPPNYYPNENISNLDINDDDDLDTHTVGLSIVLSNGKQFSLRKLKSYFYRWNIPSDTAILRIPISDLQNNPYRQFNISDIEKVPLATSSQIGEKVIKFGYTSLDFNSFHVGYVRDNNFISEFVSPGWSGAIMITSSESAGGDSGGPLLNFKGELVGIGSWGFTGQNDPFGILCQPFTKYQYLLDIPDNSPLLTATNRYKGMLIQSPDTRYPQDYVTFFSSNNINEYNTYYYASSDYSNGGLQEVGFHPLIAESFNMPNNYYDKQDIDRNESTINFKTWIKKGKTSYGRTRDYINRQLVYRIDLLDNNDNIVTLSNGPFGNFGDEQQNNIFEQIYFGKGSRVKLYIRWYNSATDIEELDITLNLVEDYRILSGVEGSSIDANKNSRLIKRESEHDEVLNIESNTENKNNKTVIESTIRKPPVRESTVRKPPVRKPPVRIG